MVQKQNNNQIGISAFKNSPIHDLKVLTEEPVWLNTKDIDLDKTNPGSITESLRNKRREPSIRDSYDILGGIIYPIIVCQNAEHTGRFIHVDGFGRLDHLRQRGKKKIRAYVYPPMTLEQRICFRQTLNAAQEPFDAASIIQDLQILAEERGLDIHNKEHVETLVRDLPERVQKHKRDILELSRWHSDAITKLGESYETNPRSIGVDQIRGLGRIMTVMQKRHEDTLEKLGGLQELSKQLVQMYIDRRFAENGKSQQGIRDTVRSLKIIQSDDPSILKFFEDKVSVRELEKAAKDTAPNEEGVVLEACSKFIDMLLGLNTQRLTEDETAALKRTATVLNSVLSEVSA